MYEMKLEKNNLKNILKLVSIFITSILIIIIFYAVKSGIFQDKNIMIEKFKKLGILGPIFFLLLQLSQVIFPMIPGGTSCLIGVLAFGPFLGFIYNYIGIITGSILAYFLSKKYGLKLIRMFFKEETIQKYMGYIRSNTFQKMFLIGILLPGLPDDLLCYMAGIGGIQLKTFLTSIFLGKTFSLFMYSFLFGFL